MDNGRLLTIVGTDPAAGVEVAEVVPAGVIWFVQSIRVTLVTDATAINREVVMRIGDGVSETQRFGGGGVLQAASLTFRYTAAAYGVQGVVDGAGADVMFPTPPGLVLYPTWTLNTLTVNLQAADDFGPPIIVVRQIG